MPAAVLKLFPTQPPSPQAIKITIGKRDNFLFDSDLLIKKLDKSEYFYSIGFDWIYKTILQM